MDRFRGAALLEEGQCQEIALRVAAFSLLLEVKDLTPQLPASVTVVPAT